MVPMYLIFMQYAGIVLELPSNVRFQMDQTNFRGVPLKHFPDWCSASKHSESFYEGYWCNLESNAGQVDFGSVCGSFERQVSSKYAFSNFTTVHPCF